MVYEATVAKKFFLVCAGLCVALSALGFIAAGVIPTASTTNHGAYPVTGWIIVACCFAMAAFFVIRAMDNKPHLRIDPDGIHYPRYSDAIIPWDQIVSWQITKVYNQRIVGLNLKNPEAYPAKSAFTRATAGLNRATVGELGIAATNLSGGHEGVLAAIRHYRPDLFTPRGV
ncbi:MAG TPA: STM3941 family protein [Allosphingosinicella sp.]|nr:STM3941 family protein [Allosphingosinicella sp.]